MPSLFLRIFCILSLALILSFLLVIDLSTLVYISYKVPIVICLKARFQVFLCVASFFICCSMYTVKYLLCLILILIRVGELLLRLQMKSFRLDCDFLVYISVLPYFAFKSL